ncbi:Iron-regulated protein frpA [Gluconacetobacter sp. SXCC-1]|nr:hypothetical protein [Komagataeibacter rhaeticus]EGG76286.1 Iron-regulated protein frpA [Gluconacetobacter sp. SXCC-1]WPP20712.1 hypothetical protein SCD25_09540 [Komagataeibacter rhaeticus]SAY47408.1 hypothetical protein KRIGEM_00345 [Komagataeibacter rhaeticus]
MMGYVTVTGATGLTLDVNPDSSDIILALKTVGEEAALSQLDQFAVNEDVTGTEIVSLKGDFSDSAFQEARLLGVAGIDYGMDDAAGPLLQEITSGGSYDVTGRAVEIGSTTATVLDQQLFLYGGSNPTDVVDGDAGTVDYHAGSGSVNYDAAGGDTLFFSGRPSDDVNLMAGSDTVYAFDSTPTVTGDWDAAGSTTALFNGAGTTLTAIDGEVVQDISHSTINAFVNTTFFEDEGAQVNIIQDGLADTINGDGALAVESVSGSSITADSGLSVTGGSGDTISASASALLSGVDDSTISVSVPGTLQFINGASGIADTVTGGNATIFGTAGLDLTASTSGTTTYYASSGNETLDGGLSTGRLYAVAGSGNDTLVGGSGQDTLQAGTGNDLLKAGSGTTEFDFIKGKDGGNDLIQDFGKSAANVVNLSGFDATPATIQSMLDNATIAGGNTTISLGDSTKITFVGVTDLKVQNFKS